MAASTPEMDKAFPTLPTPNLKINDIIHTIIETEKASKEFLDLTGRFSYRSAQGNQYVMAANHMDTKAILMQAIKTVYLIRSEGHGEISMKEFTEQVNNQIIISLIRRSHYN